MQWRSHCVRTEGEDLVKSNVQRFAAVLPRTLALAILFLASAAPLSGQAVSIASVTGRVTDEQEAVVAGAQVRMKAVETGAAYNAVTNMEGIYTFPTLPIGAYTLEVTAPGFQTWVQTSIQLRVNDSVQIN